MCHLANNDVNWKRNTLEDLFHTNRASLVASRFVHSGMANEINWGNGCVLTHPYVKSIVLPLNTSNHWKVASPPTTIKRCSQQKREPNFSLMVQSTDAKRILLRKSLPPIVRLTFTLFTFDASTWRRMEWNPLIETCRNRLTEDRGNLLVKYIYCDAKTKILLLVASSFNNNNKNTCRHFSF